MTPGSRSEAEALDRADPLAGFREEFVIDDPELIYLDGNSLGRLPRAAAAAVERSLRQEWGEGLVRSWHDWIGLPERIGDRLAPLIGAAPGEVLVCDQTSVNLFKLAFAGLRHSGRSVIVGDDSNFPSDRYVLRAAAEARGGEYREVAVDPVAGPSVADLAPAVDASAGVVSLSLVSFRSAAIADLHAITAMARDRGALVLWDLSHAAGAVPVDLGAAGADLAVGCTYKYLNGGPGSPAFLFVRRGLQRALASPIPGWFGHDDMFAFEGAYRPADSIRRFAAGTPPILSLRGVEIGVAMMARAGIDAIREKSVALTELLVRRAEQVLLPLGFELASPRDPARRGSHVTLSHPQGYAICRALIERGVVPDFRAPDLIRLGVAPLYTRYAEVFDAVERLAEVVAAGAYRRFGGAPQGKVT